MMANLDMRDQNQKHNKKNQTLLKLLNEKDILALEEAIRPNASKDEKKKGEDILKQFVAATGSSTRTTRTINRPGPKSQSKTNKIDKQIRILLDYLRIILNFPKECSNQDILWASASLISDTNELLQNNILLTKEERCLIIKEKGFFETGFSEYNDDALQIIAEAQTSDLADDFQFYLITILLKCKKDPSKNTDSSGENSNPYIFIASILKLDLPEQLEILSQLSTEEKMEADLSLHSLKELNATRAEILQSLISRIIFIKNLLKDNLYCLSKDSIRNFCTLVEDMPPPRRSTLITDSINNIDTILSNAIIRQGTNPLKHDKMEHFGLNPLPSEPGDIRRIL